ncbi:hypothetical protein [Pseudogemmobacter sonorensis]|uniref:hypothetical protein n=1 Tax=Pseudogemmobacter sonorensis TaxID=2989681 RepID=UPI00368CDCD0
MRMLGPQDLEELELLEELDKRRARSSFLAFYMRMTGFMPQPHHKLTCRFLQAMEDNLIDRGMVFMPRRMAKSTLCTQLFPAWLMGIYPREFIMSAVHTQKYAEKTGKIVRNLLRAPEFPFDTQLATDSQAKSQWATTEGGEYNGFGLMGGSTHGNPASWLIMDDLIRGRKMALSPHMREEAWETYKADLVSSLQGRKKQLIVTTRWHEDDPAGRILPLGFDGRTGWYEDRETGEKWYVLSLPAIAERDDDPLGRKIGEPMWPEEFADKFRVAQMRGGFIWSALYQQRPSPDEGILFTRDHVTRFDLNKVDLTRLETYISSDYAVTADGESTDPDYTVHMVWGVDGEHNIYLLDMWRGRTQSDEWIMHWLRLVKKWKPLRAFEEQGQIIKSVGPMIRTMMQKHRVFVSRVQIVSDMKKVPRAQALLGWAAMGKMFLPHRHTCPAAWLPHLEEFEKELLQFPGGRHDDTVDAATLFGRALDRIVAGQHPGKPPSPHGDTLDDLWSRHEDR